MNIITLLNMDGKQQQHAFVSLCILQAFVFIMSFSCPILYRMQRLSYAHKNRLDALANRSLLMAVYPVILADCSSELLASNDDTWVITIFTDNHHKKMLITKAKEDNTTKILKFVLLNEQGHHKSFIYLVFIKADYEKMWCFSGIQFGEFL